MHNPCKSYAHSMRMILCVVALTLSACAAPGPVTEPIPFTLDATGVQLVGSPQRIDFGRTDHSVIPAMTKLVGRGPVAQSVCGAVSRIDWPDIALFFEAGDFRGWQSGETRAGVTCR